LKREIIIEFKIDDSKALEIAKVLFDQFYNRKGFFKNTPMPEYVLPRNLEEGTKEHALYLTFVISIDYMTDAEKLWKKARGMYELYPERFKPKKILELSQRSVESIVKKLGARFYKNGANTWKTISRILLEKYEGDPRNITSEPMDIKNSVISIPYNPVISADVNSIPQTVGLPQ